MPAIGGYGVASGITMDGDVLFRKIRIGSMTSSSGFLTIETMALHHHLWLFPDCQCDVSAVAAAYGKWFVIHSFIQTDYVVSALLHFLTGASHRMRCIAKNAAIGSSLTGIVL